MLEYLQTNMSLLATGLSSIVFFKASIFSYEMPLIVLWLVLGALFFTVYLNFINIRGFTHAIGLISGKITGKVGAAGENISFPGTDNGGIRDGRYW